MDQERVVVAEILRDTRKPGRAFGSVSNRTSLAVSESLSEAHVQLADGRDVAVEIEVGLASQR